MTIIEKKSKRKAKAIKLLVEDGEYSIAYAMILAEQLNDEGKLLDEDYEELMDWLEARLEPEEEPEMEESTIEEELPNNEPESEGEVE